MKVLVTGGGGFLGSAIVRMLIERGEAVRILARGDYPKLREIGVETLRGDIADVDRVKTACRDCDAVIHTAAKAGMWGKHDEYYSANTIGTENVIEACRAAGVGRLVYTSSPSVAYSRNPVEGGDESLQYPEKYDAHYSATKALAEKLVLAANNEQLATCSLRPHLIWGPGDNHLIPRIIARARKGRVRFVGDGQNKIDTIFIDNAAHAHLLALDRLTPGAACAGKVYFISQDDPRPTQEIINGILNAAGVPPVKKYISLKTAFVAGAVLEGVFGLFGLKEEPPMTRFLAYQLSLPHWFDIGAAKRDLGYQPIVTIEEGFARLAEWFAEKGDQ